METAEDEQPEQSGGERPTEEPPRMKLRDLRPEKDPMGAADAAPAPRPAE